MQNIEPQVLPYAISSLKYKSGFIDQSVLFPMDDPDSIISIEVQKVKEHKNAEKIKGLIVKIDCLEGMFFIGTESDLLPTRLISKDNELMLCPMDKYGKPGDFLKVELVH